MLINSYRFGYTATDANAAAYITAVETADGQTLESATKAAIDAFVVGCKADGIWTAIKASCILAGARTLAGALVPLVGTAPTNFNFVSGDYNRKTGLVGDGATKYLNSNRSNSADPQNNNHNACYVGTAAAGVLMASSSALTGQNYLDITANPLTRFASRINTVTYDVSGSALPGLYGHSRIASNGFSIKCPQGSGSSTISGPPLNAALTSQTADSRNIFLYTRTDNGTTFSAWSSARLAFYSIGESLNLALLDTRVTALITAINAAF